MGVRRGTMLCAVSFRFVIHFMIDIILLGETKKRVQNASLSLSSALTQKRNVFLYLLLRVWWIFQAVCNRECLSISASSLPGPPNITISVRILCEKREFSVSLGLSDKAECEQTRRASPILLQLLPLKKMVGVVKLFFLENGDDISPPPLNNEWALLSVASFLDKRIAFCMQQWGEGIGCCANVAPGPLKQKTE
jgi:hypothetical protein